MARIRDDEELDKLREQHCLYKLQTGYQIVNGLSMPTVFAQYLEFIDNFEVFDDDVWVTGVPKSGTSWVQEMVWIIAKDFEKTNMSRLTRFPYFEMSFMLEGVDTLAILNSLLETKRPRFIKTHLPWNLLPRQIRTFEKRPKIFHVLRNPKDVCVSYYHYIKLMDNYSGDFDLFWQLFIRGKLKYTPTNKIILTYWEKRNEPNVCILKYEDMKANLPSVIRNVTTFMGKTLDEQTIQKMQEHLSFDSMRKDPAKNCMDAVKFMHRSGARCVEGQAMRKGIVGDHKSEMSPEIIKVFDEWIATNFEGTGLSFD